MKLRHTITVALALLPGLASADYTTESVPRILPYHGQLELDGFAVTGDVAMRFTLYDDQGAAAWSEEWSDDPDTKSCGDVCLISVVEGRFTAWLGRHRSISGALLDGAPRDLEIAVREEGAWRILSPRQTLTPTPRAMWLLEADDLVVEGALTVDGAARVEGDARAGESLVIERGVSVSEGVSAASATITGDASASSVSVGANLFVGALSITDGRLYFTESERGDGGAAISHDRNNVLGIGTVERQYVDIVGDVTADAYSGTAGLTTFTNGLTFPDWTLIDDRHMFYARYFNIGSTQNYNTRINGNHWMCWIGGVRMTDGDLCEYETARCSDSGANEVGAILSVFAYPDRYTNHEWRIHAEFLTHTNDEEAEVLLVCAQVDAVGLRCPDSAGYWRSDCSGQYPYFNIGDTSLFPNAWRW